MTTINNFIKSHEEIKFTATYNVTQSIRNPTNDKYSGSTGKVTQVDGVDGFSFINNSYQNNDTGIPGAPRYIFEVYSLSSVGVNQEYLGNCVWQSSYPNIQSLGQTGYPIFEFGVSSKTGIYESVNKVVIDFTNEVRVIYLIGHKKHCNF